MTSESTDAGWLDAMTRGPWTGMFSIPHASYDLTKRGKTPPPPCGYPPSSTGAVKADAHFSSCVRGLSEDESNQFRCPFSLWKREGFGQFVNEGFGKGSDFDRVCIHRRLCF